MKTLKKFVFFILLFSANFSFAQIDGSTLPLANEYYEAGEYEKAIDLYEKLAKNKRYFFIVHEYYFDALKKTEQFEKAEKYLKKAMKENPNEFYLQIDYALLLRSLKKNTESDKIFNDFIQKVKNDDMAVRSNLYVLLSHSLYDVAEKLLLAAQASNNKSYASDLANVYGFAGKTEKMLEEYLNVLGESDANLDFLLNTLPYKLTSPEDLDRFEPLIFQRIQKNPEKIAFAELIVWLYMQKQEYYNAFLQARAVDKRKMLDGTKIFEIGNSALINKDYKNAVKIFDYLVEKYPDSPNFYNYKLHSMRAKEELIKNTFPLDIEQVKSLVNEYKSNLKIFGINFRMAEIARNLALLEAFYLNEKDSAIIILEKVVALGAQNNRLVSKAKLDLGDIYLLKSEWWESTLLYSQVEKAEKELDLGHLAKLKNAKLSYYRGEFELAKEHLDILKLATSREISNDAMNLSILIMDNTGLDTSTVAMQEYARIDLLVFQQQYETAIKDYEKMLVNFKDHALEDEIIWQLANLNLKIGKYDVAVNHLQKILKDFPDEIYGDDANFLLGKIYQEYLNNKEKAMECFQHHLVKYTGSLYTVEARKRFRELRGDGKGL